MNAVIPPPVAAPVRANTKPQCASPAAVIQSFVPLMT